VRRHVRHLEHDLRDITLAARPSTSVSWLWRH
jgi:hypothetical protein